MASAGPRILGHSEHVNAAAPRLSTLPRCSIPSSGDLEYTKATHAAVEVTQHDGFVRIGRPLFCVHVAAMGEDACSVYDCRSRGLTVSQASSHLSEVTGIKISGFLCLKHAVCTDSMQVSAGGLHTALLRSDGRVLTVGNNRCAVVNQLV